MSMVLTRSPLEAIGMNGAGTQKRRSARLSHEGNGENEPPSKKAKVNGAQTTTVSTKEQDGDNNAATKRRSKKAYDEEVDGFAFTKGRSKKAKEPKQPAVRNSATERASTPPPPAQPKESAPLQPLESVPAPVEDAPPKTAQKKARRRFPTTPEREAAEKPVRRSKRLSDENTSANAQPQSSPQRPAHARSHAKTDRSPSPEKARPVTVEKKRKKGPFGAEEEEKIMRIALPFDETPVIRRNKDIRKSSADGHRRSSSGMRGQRASSMIDDGRGNGKQGISTPPSIPRRSNLVSLPAEVPGLADTALLRSQPVKHMSVSVTGSPTPPASDAAPSLMAMSPEDPQAHLFVEDTLADRSFPGSALPHAEVPTAEFFKHISADLTEPRRMRCLLGWCGARALPPKPDAPKESTPASNREFQALQSARVIQDELSQDLVSKGTLSDWFSRDEAAPPQVPLRKKPNPRNVANVAKVEELERELERLKKERAEWDDLMKSAVLPQSPTQAGEEMDTHLSPLHPELLDSPQRAILEQLQAPATEASTDPEAIQKRLQDISENLEFAVDQFAHGIHALSTTRETAERLADKTLADAADVLETREKARRAEGKGADAFSALKALGKVMNGQRR